MNIISKVAVVLTVSFSLGLAFSTYGSTLQGVVKDSKGHAVSGAEVRLEAKNGSTVRHTRTDERGRYVQSDLSGGTYRVTLIVDGQTRASITNVTPRESETEVLNFRFLSGHATPFAAGKHYVLLKSPTGTNLDRWVEAGEMPGQMSVGMQERSRSSADTVVRAFQQNAQAVRY